MKKLMITLGMFATFCTTEAKVTLPALFTDNMVLQQKSDITLRGHSTNRKEVMADPTKSVFVMEKNSPYTTS